MTDQEKIELIMKYSFNTDFVLKSVYIDELNNFIRSSGTDPDDLLKVYKAKIRYEAFKEFTSDLDRILYGRLYYE